MLYVRNFWFPGSVMHGIILQDTGHHYVRVQGGNVAIKRMHRETIERRRGRTQEDPLKEIAAMQFISYPGHPNVLRQIECVEDAENVRCRSLHSLVAVACIMLIFSCFFGLPTDLFHHAILQRR